MFNHDGPDATPLSCVAYHPNEDTEEHSGLRKMLTKYRKHNVMEETGISFTEFLDLPRDLCQSILDECAEAAVEKSKAMNEIEQLKQQMNNK